MFQPTPSADAESDEGSGPTVAPTPEFQPTPSADAESDASIALGAPGCTKMARRFNPRPPPTRRATRERLLGESPRFNPRPPPTRRRPRPARLPTRRGFNPRPPPTRRATAPGVTARKYKPIEALFANPAPREPGGRLVPPRDTRNGRGSAHIQAARTSRTWSTGRGSRAAGQKTSGPDGSIGRRTPWCSVRADASSRRK